MQPSNHHRVEPKTRRVSIVDDNRCQPGGIDEARFGRREFLRAALLGAGALGLGIPTRSVAETASRVLHLNTAFGPPISTPDGTGFFDRLMREVGARTGYKVRIQTPPAERALMLANAGIDDGDGPRIPSLDYTGNYPNLIRMNEALLNVDFVAFTSKPNVSVNGWKSLSDYEISIVTGWKILERQLSNHTHLIKVKDPENLFRLLKYGRTDVAIIDRFSGLVTAKKLGLSDCRIIEPPLISTPMYLYLHSSHADLAVNLNRALLAMKTDGTYERIYRETLRRDHR